MMSSSSIVPENVARVLPSYITSFFDNQTQSKTRAKPRNVHNRLSRGPFDFRRPNRTPIYMPVFLALTIFTLLCFIMYSRFKNHLSMQLDSGGLCNSSQFLGKKNVLFLLMSAEDMIVVYPTLSALTFSEKYNIYATVITGGLKKEQTDTIYHRSVNMLNLKKENIETLRFVTELEINILEKIQKVNIDLIIGVGDNWKGDKSLIRELSEKSDSYYIPKGVSVFELEEVGLLRRISSFLDIPYSYVGCEVMFVSNWTVVYSVVDDLTDGLWTWLWIPSRYLVVNTLHQLR